MASALASARVPAGVAAPGTRGASCVHRWGLGLRARGIPQQARGRLALPSLGRMAKPWRGAARASSSGPQQPTPGAAVRAGQVEPAPGGPSRITLPTISIAPFAGVALDAVAQHARDSAEAQECVQRIRDACSNVGFFYLVDHGVPQDLVDGARDVTRRFFQLPDEQKQRIALENSPHFRGYQRVGQNITKGRRDWHEAMDFYREFPSDHPDVVGKRPLHGANQWPEEPEDFKPLITEYVDTMNELGLRVMRMIALSLDLPPDEFEKGRADVPFWVLRAIGYPPLPESAAEEGSVSCGEHTDYGLLTFVNQDPGITALQVRNRSGAWMDAPPIPGAFVVNIGDMLTIWTNGLYPSTAHRVVNRSSTYRVSVPFFYEPNFDAVVAPIPQCVETSEGKKALYDPVVYGEHLIRKVTTNFV